ncbi:MAG: DJ-1/PfpI family protein [Verrucomicrobia bacterium]|nr:DJ-1/PfpI family protein [Verrucomicrobiota bacterium]
MNGPPRTFILVVIAFERFRDEEYLVPREVFEAAGCAVTTCSTRLGTATGKLGAKVEVDVVLGEVSAAGYDAVVFVGGPGSKTLWDDAAAQGLARELSDAGRLVCAICSAPIILARAGLLDGRSATCFEGDRAELERRGAIYTGGEVTLDGRFITGSGPAAADAFAHAIVERLGAGTGE